MTFDIVEPYIEKIAFLTKQIFVYMDLCYCSFFILGIVEFWNLTLLYNFLSIKSVPQFATAFFSKMMNFFFTFNSLTITINKLLQKKDTTQNLFNYSALT